MEQNSQTPITPNNGGTTPPTQKKGSKKKKVVFIIVGASIAFFLLLTCIGGVTAFILIQNQNKDFSWSDDDDYDDEIAIYDDYDDEQDDDYIYANAITDDEAPVEVYDDEYIEDDDYYGTNADIFTKKLTESDLAGASKYDLEIMRNMIYAWHGYKFKRQDLTEYFSQFSWYTPTNSDASSVYNEFSAIEKYNVEFIKKHE